MSSLAVLAAGPLLGVVLGSAAAYIYVNRKRTVAQKESDEDDDACTNHHYGDSEPQNYYDIRTVTEKRIIGNESDLIHVDWTKSPPFSRKVEEREDEPVRLEERTVLFLKQKHVKTCEHHGCFEKKYTWKRVGKTLVEDIVDDDGE